MDINHALFWACGAVCAVAELLIIRAALQPPPETATSASVPHSSRGIEIMWGIAPVFALIAIFWAAWRTLY